MKTCPRCGSAMLREWFEDPRGSGDAWACIACGNRLETYTRLRSGAYTPEQINELMQPQRLGRPRSGQMSLEGAK